MFYRIFKWARPYGSPPQLFIRHPELCNGNSSCFQATQIAWSTVTGDNYGPRHPTAIRLPGLGCNGYMTPYQLARRGTRGGKARARCVIVVPQLTHTTESGRYPSARYIPGTDGAPGWACAVTDNRKWMVRQSLWDGQHVHDFDMGSKELASPYTWRRQRKSQCSG